MNALLQARGITRRFGGVVALDHLDIDVNRDEVVGLIGPNGSGKTTFFNVVTGIYPVNDGTVTFDGADLTSAPAPAVYNAGIARTFQRSRLCLALSVFDNLMIGNHRRLSLGLTFNLLRRKAFARELAQHEAHARSLLRTFHPTLPERLFDPAGELGMIDRRRVEVCRALIGEPKLLLLDEPSAGMTHDETYELMEDVLAVRQRQPRLSVILIEHEMGVIERISQRCAVLNFGEKICEGPYAAVVSDPRVREAYLGME
ncbi:MAG: ABC transporter ATP-binding protein [Burkholderiales bacterium]|nr:ABC transporter ATP-binding protein [Burkholderiales bacterium]MCW5623056.1 ABC transporter ATP-binding protein [Burkholderiales bacterium]